jgi:hypothetical protein
MTASTTSIVFTDGTTEDDKDVAISRFARKTMTVTERGKPLIKRQ